MLTKADHRRKRVDADHEIYSAKPPKLPKLSRPSKPPKPLESPESCTTRSKPSTKEIKGIQRKSDASGLQIWLVTKLLLLSDLFFRLFW